MVNLLIGAMVLVAVLWAVGRVQRANPAAAARVVKASGGIAVLAFALFLLLRGQIDLAVGLGVLGFGLLGWSSFGDRLAAATSTISRLRAPFVELDLDSRTGAAKGRMIAGRYAGTPLDALDAATLAAILPEVDEDSRGLLMAYLDRRHPGWREHAQGDAAPGRAARASGKMPEEEAYQILGVTPGASDTDISRAHRSLMKKLHPDQGGSTYLAARVNEAKEILLRRHRR